MSALTDTWHISHRINEYLLSGINETHLSDISLAKGRPVGHQFAHIHNVRLMWVQASAPDLLPGLNKIDKDQPITKKLLLDSLQKSAAAIGEVIKRGEETGKVKGFKPTPEAFLGYIIAHESYHRGQLVIALKENGHLPDKKILFGMWEWGVR